MFEVSDTPRTARTNGYIQRSALRTKGDKVYITGDTRCDVENIRRLLMKAARRFNLRMIEVANMVEAVAIIRDNPDAPDRVVGIATAPHPLSKINEGVAWERFSADIERTNAILADEDTGIDVIAWIANWQADWCRFWSLRHRDPAQRADFAATLTYNRTKQQPEIRRIIRRQFDA